MIIAILAILLALFASNAEATQEARCTDLGVNCICSEPLQMTGFAANAPWYNPNDSTTKECQSNIAGGYAILSTGSTPQVTSAASILNQLPAGHSVQRVLRYPEAHTGQNQIDHYEQFGGGIEGRARVAVRWYRYYSPNWEWKTGGGCGNSSKYFVPYPGGGQWDTSFGVNFWWIFYGIQATINGVYPSSQGGNWDCCNIPPGADPGTPSSITEGNWFRIEVIMRQWSSSSPTTRLEGYRKDVTANGQNYKFIDSTVACENCGTIGFIGEDWPANSGMQMLGPLSQVEVNLFRNAAAEGDGICSGFAALSHVLVAAWDTDAGQFIGAASEVEGGGGGPTPPIAPTNLRISELLRRFWGTLWAMR